MMMKSHEDGSLCQKLTLSMSNFRDLMLRSLCKMNSEVWYRQLVSLGTQPKGPSKVLRADFTKAKHLRNFLRYTSR